jgi:hypothetical protein
MTDESKHAVIHGGYVITPHSFPVKLQGNQPIAWSVGVFIREEQQTPAQNKYYGQKVTAGKTYEEALALGIQFGRLLIDRDLLKSMRHDDSPPASPELPESTSASDDKIHRGR